MGREVVNVITPAITEVGKLGVKFTNAGIGVLQLSSGFKLTLLIFLTIGAVSPDSSVIAISKSYKQS